MKIFIYFIVLSFTSVIYPQSNCLRGVVFVSNNPYPNVNIKNISSGNSIITNENGEFILSANYNDLLVFSSIDLDSLKLIITEKDLKEISKNIFMKRMIIELSEVLIEKYPNINAVSLGIISKKQKKYTPAQRKLYTAGDFKPIQLLNLLGGSMQLDPIFNAINGKTKELKKNIEVENKEINIAFFKTNYYDYLFTNLRLSKEEINSFLYYLVEKESTQEILKSSNDNKIKFFLCDTLIEYRVKMK